MQQGLETTYRVQGMTCAHCERAVVQAVDALAGVESAAADHVPGELWVVGRTTEEEIRGAVERAGYALSPTGSRDSSPGIAGRSSCGCGC